jgi:hypothetical protein
MAGTPQDRPSLLPELHVLYGRLADIEADRTETKKLLRLALDRVDREEAAKIRRTQASLRKTGGGGADA